MTITSFTNKQEVYRFISSAASYGNLGLFIGTGFSKAVLNDDENQIALSWGEHAERSVEHHPFIRFAKQSVDSRTQGLTSAFWYNQE